MTLSKPTGTNDMTRRDQENLIWRKCLEANPDIEKRAKFEHPEYGWCVEIRLSDVLLAYQGDRKPPYDMQHLRPIIEGWDLRNDNMLLQKSETIEFVAGALPN